MKNILVVCGHTEIENSVANRLILEELKKSLVHVEIDYLDKLYGDSKINVALEQKKLIDADIVVFEFPFFWYSCPSIMHRWMEQVLVHGFSHGASGDKLRGKKLVLSFTAGAGDMMYQKDGFMEYEIEEFLPPFKAMAKLVSMEFAGFVFSGGVSYQLRGTDDGLDKIKEIATNHAGRLVTLLNQL